MNEAEDVTLRYQGRVFVCLLLIFLPLLLNFTPLFSISLRPVYLVQSVGTLQCETRSAADLSRTRGRIIHFDSFGLLLQHILNLRDRGRPGSHSHCKVSVLLCKNITLAAWFEPNAASPAL